MKRVVQTLTAEQYKRLSKNFSKFVLSAHYLEWIGQLMKGKLTDDKLRMRLDMFLTASKSFANYIERIMSDNQENELYDDLSSLDLLIELGIAAEKSKQSFEFKNDIYKLQAKYLKK